MIGTMLKFMRQTPMGLVLRLMKTVNHTYRAGFLSAGLSSGILARLAAQPAEAEALHRELGMQGPVEGLRAWLDLGVTLGELSKGAGGYRLKGRLAKGLVEPSNDVWSAFLQSRVDVFLDHATGTPARLAQGTRPPLDPAQGRVMARASRTVEPILLDLIDRSLPRSAPCRLLEVGCGTGVYMRRACERNPELSAVGLELQGEVAELARANLAEWGLAERTRVFNTDLRDFRDPDGFDLATLHNLIYYFPVDQRVAVLKNLAALLKPGGAVWLTTLCPGSDPSVAALDLWASMTEGCGPLPSPEELSGQMGQAGLAVVKSRRLAPGYRFFECAVS